MVQLSVRESFELVYILQNTQVERELAILKKVTKQERIGKKDYPKTPSMTEIHIIVDDIFQAVEIINKIKMNVFEIEEIEQDYKMGLLSPDQKKEQLSKYMEV